MQQNNSNTDEQFLFSISEELRARRKELELREREISDMETKTGHSRVGLRTGDRVKTRRHITFKSGKVSPLGSVGVVTKIPGDLPGSIAEVKILETGLCFDASDRDVEPLVGQNTLPAISQGYITEEENGVLRAQVEDLARENDILREHFKKVQLEGEERQRRKPSGEKIDAVPPPSQTFCCDDPDSKYCKKTGLKHSSSTHAHRSKIIPGSTKSLIISVSHFGTPEKLRNSIETGLAVKSFLQREGFAGSCVHLTEEVPVKSPTRANIIRCLNWLVSGAKPGDCLYLHFIGHSLLPDDCSQLRDDQRVPFQGIAPVDVHEEGYVYVDEMVKIFETLPKGSKLTAVFDTEPCGMTIPLQYKFLANGGELFSESCVSLPATIVAVSCEPSRRSHANTLTPPSRGPQETHNGSFTTAYITSMEMQYRPTTVSVLTGIRSLLHQYKIPYSPVVVSSTPFLSGDILKLGTLTKIEEQRRLRNWGERLSQSGPASYNQELYDDI